MMHGMFRSNGGCGYVKKPDLLMKTCQSNEVFDPKLPWPVRQTLKVSKMLEWKSSLVGQYSFSSHFT